MTTLPRLSKVLLVAAATALLNPSGSYAQGLVPVGPYSAYFSVEVAGGGGFVFRGGDGSGWNAIDTFTNITDELVRVDFLRPAVFADPASLGVPNLEVGNYNSTLLAYEQDSPGLSLYGGYLWSGGPDTPTKNWVAFEVETSIPTPFVVGPGESFEVTTVLRNTTTGPDRTSPLNVPLSDFAFANDIGEVVFAFDGRFTVVPEPSSLLLALGLFVFSTNGRRVAMKASASE